MLSPRFVFSEETNHGATRDAPATACVVYADRPIPPVPAQVQVHVRGPAGAGVRAGGARLRLRHSRRGGVPVAWRAEGQAATGRRGSGLLRELLEPRDSAPTCALRREGHEGELA